MAGMPQKRRRQPLLVRRQPLSGLRRGVRRSRVRVMPASIGGLNARDGLEAMPASDAVLLDNWWPTQSYCITRPGYSLFCDTGGGANDVNVMMPFEYAGVSKLIAACNGIIYEVSTGTASSLASGFSGNNWVGSILSGKLIMANGADIVKSYDGSVIASPAFTGVTLSLLNFVTTYKSRIYLIEKNTQKMWYGGVGSIAGALTSFNIGAAVAAKGDLMLLGHLSGDGGDGGQDDIFVAIFAGGTVVAYTGSDPGDATNWALLGVFEIGRPLSRHGLIQAEDDIYLVTSRGYEKLSDVMRFGRFAADTRMLSSKIQGAVNDAIERLGANEGWRMHIWPTPQMMITTVPFTGSARVHYVRNIATGAWATFSSLPALSWAQLGKDCYFGSNDGKIYKMSFSKYTDAGASIRSSAQPAWSALGFKGYIKSVKFIRPLIRASVLPTAAVSVGADFGDIKYGSFEAAEAGTDIYVWGTAVWGTAQWSVDEQTDSPFFQGDAEGYEIGIRFTTVVTQSAVKWFSTGVVFEPGGLV